MTLSLALVPSLLTFDSWIDDVLSIAVWILVYHWLPVRRAGSAEKALGRPLKIHRRGDHRNRSDWAS